MALIRKSILNRINRTAIVSAALAAWIPVLTGCEKKPPKTEQSTAAAPDSDHKHDTIESYYTCSMHPNIKSEKPGKCPICYMNLTKVEVDNSDIDIPAITAPAKASWQCKEFPDVLSDVPDTCPLDGTPMIEVRQGPKPSDVVAKIKLKKSQFSHFRPEFFPVSPMKMSRSIRLLGSVTQSEQRESNITARVPGRVEKVYVKSTGSLVRPGDPLVKLYSPQLITAGEEYILARNSAKSSATSDFNSLISQSAKKLRLWGIPRAQFESWYRKGRVPKHITIYSNARGVVRKRNATKGRYFKEGQNFFELSDLSTIWVEMDVYEHDAALVKIGQKVSLKFSALPGKDIQGVIDFVNPVLDPKSRTLKVRATIPNQDNSLMPGMVADATLRVDLAGKPLVVPRSAVIDSGERKIVWIKLDARRFQAKLVQTGRESEGYIEVTKGLMDGELVVTEGSFLLDAQAQLFGGYENFKTTSRSDPHANH